MEDFEYLTLPTYISLDWILYFVGLILAESLP